MTHSIETIVSTIFDSDNISVNDSDLNFLSSIHRQLKRRVPLTDRQYLIVKDKVANYRDQLMSMGVDFDTAVRILDMPIRSIDRSKTITIDRSSSAFSDEDLIKIRFPFNKKTILLIDELSKKHASSYYHKTGSHEHYFRIRENIVKDIIDVLGNKDFEISSDILKLNEVVNTIVNNPLEHLPSIYNYEFRNLNDSAIKLIESEVGIPSSDNMIKLYDRRYRYGINNIDYTPPETLAGIIASRTTTDINIDETAWSIEDVVSSIQSLDRFPLLVILDKEKSLEQLQLAHSVLEKIIPNEKQTVLFRVDSSPEFNLNDYVKEKKINNYLDESTQVVYLSKTSLPKLILRTEWKPMCVLGMSSLHFNNNFKTYIYDVCDLIIWHDRESSLIRRKKSTYGLY